MAKLTTMMAIITSALIASSALAAESSVTPYLIPNPVNPDTCPYTVRVNGETMPIYKAGEYQGCYYTQFEYTGTIKAEVQVKATAATWCILKPDRYHINKKDIYKGIAFDISTPGTRVITSVSGSKELWPIMLIAEEPEEDFTAARPVFKVNDYLEGEGPQTANIQKALDKAASRGGIVYFTPGVYETGPLFIKDNTIVFLAPGTLIKATTNNDEYNTEMDHYWSRSPGAKVPALINFSNCKNSALIGRGIIDATGHILRDKYGLHVQALKIVRSENIEVKDVILQNAASWTTQFLGSKDIRVDNMKILADWAVGNTDGINPDCSQNVTVTRYFGYCGDDGWAIKTTTNHPELQGCKNIRLSDSVVMTRKTAFKIGTETHKNISDVVIENCEAINTSRGLAIYLEDGAEISNITYRNIKLDLMEYPGEGRSGAPFIFAIGDRNGVGKLHDLTFENITGSVPWASGFHGRENSKIENVTFNNCALEIRNRSIKMWEAPVFTIEHCRNVNFNDFKLNWHTDLDQLWKGFLEKKNSENVVVEKLQEIRK